MKSQDIIKISFGEKLNSTLLRGSGLDEASWLIYDGEGKIVEQGKSDKIYNVSFDLPGVYSIQFKHEHKHEGHANTCNHYAMPNEVKVQVSSRKIIFDTDNVTFSKKITSAMPADGITMYIPITIIDERNNEVAPLNKNIISYGINTTIEGHLKAEYHSLSPGKYVIEYILSGNVSKGSYIGFDLIDNNSNVYTFGLSEPIQ